MLQIICPTCLVFNANQGRHHGGWPRRSTFWHAMATDGFDHMTLFDGLTENAGHEIAGHEIAGQNNVRPTLHYYEVCSCLLLFS